MIWNCRIDLFKGWITTVQITAAALVLSTAGGFVLALGQRSYVLPLRYFAKVLVEIVRCTPLLVLIYLLWYGLGGALGIGNNWRYIMGVLTISLFEAAYISEIFRSGIESVGKSQIESARAIGFTRTQTYRYVIIPQAFSPGTAAAGRPACFTDQGLVAPLGHRHFGAHPKRATGQLEQLR